MRALLIPTDSNEAINVIVCEPDFTIEGFDVVEVPKGSRAGKGWLIDRKTGDLTEPVPEQIPDMERVDFRRRFTPDEYLAAKKLAGVDAQIAYDMDVLLDADVVNVEQPETVKFVDVLQQRGVLTPERAAEILARADKVAGNLTAAAAADIAG